MGLAMVYGIVTQNGGHIETDSAPQKGTTFTVYLPMSEGLEDAEKDAENRPMPKGTETVLVAEDDTIVRRLVQRTLTGLGSHVMVSLNGLEAVKNWEKNNQCVDLLLTDVVMPEMGGKALAEHLCDKQPNLKVIYMSGYTDMMGDGERGIPDVVFLEKPFEPLDLANKVREVLDR